MPVPLIISFFQKDEEHQEQIVFIKTKLWLLGEQHSKVVQANNARLPPKLLYDQLLKNWLN